MPATPTNIGHPGNPGRPIAAPTQSGQSVTTVIGGIQQTPNKLPDQNQRPNLSRLVTRPPQVWYDSGSGTITLSGSSVESFGIVPPQKLKAVSVPAPTEARLGTRLYPQPKTSIYNDSGSGTIVLSGTSSETFTVVPPKVYRASAVEIIPARLGSRLFKTGVVPVVYTDSASGTIVLSGSSIESFGVAPRLAAGVQGRTNQGGVVSLAQVWQPLGLQPRSITLQALAKNTTYSDSASGTIVLSGTGIDQYGSLPRVVVVTQGRGNQSAIAAYMPPPADVKQPQAQTFLFYNSAPPIFNVIVPGSTNQGYKFFGYQAVEVSPGRLGSRRVVVPLSNSLTYNDSRSGQIVLTGTATDLRSAADSGTVTITLTGFGNENFQGQAAINNRTAVDPNLVPHLTLGVR